MRSPCHHTWRTCTMYSMYPTHVLEEYDIQYREDLTVDVEPVRTLDSQVKKLRGKEIRAVKVIWDKATWEMEDLMKQSYPHLFLGK